ncbi:MAG: hypothetical protein ABEJ87_01360 [Candidatus Nanohalobium sp.]
MKLTIPEENYIEDLAKFTQDLYGNNWRSVLKKASVPLPRKGFHSRTEYFHEFDTGKEEKVIKQLQKKNIVVIRNHEIDIQGETDFHEKYSDGNNQFIGIRPEKLSELHQHLNLDG